MARSRQPTTKPTRMKPVAVRPREITGLLSEDVTFNGWEAVSASRKRFYVDGFFWFLSAAGHSDVRFLVPYAKNALEVLRAETEWSSFPADWSDKLSYNQFLEVRESKPLLFHKAVAVILTCELCARDLKMSGGAAFDLESIYKKMKIVPAVYNIDKFNTDLLQSMIRELPNAVRQLLGAAAGQTEEQLVWELADGYCVTSRTANDLKAGLNTHFSKYDVGEVRFRPGKKRLGKKRASLAENMLLS